MDGDATFITSGQVFNTMPILVDGTARFFGDTATTLSISNSGNDFNILVVSGADDVFVGDATDLTLGSIDATGNVDVAVSGALTVAGNVNALFGDVLLMTDDAVTTGQDIVVNAGATIFSATGTITVVAGDNIDIARGATLSTSNQINLVGDAGSVDTAGATIDVAASSFERTNDVVLDGGDDSDTFNLILDADVAIVVNGALPTTPTPGDTIIFDPRGQAATVTGPVLGNGTIAVAGFTNVVTFTGIEVVRQLAPLVAVGSSQGVRVFRGTDSPPLYTFTGLGDRVAIGDVNADGIDDILIGSSNGGRTVTVINGDTGLTLATFQAFAANFTGGVYVAAGDINGDDFSDIIVGQGKGAGSIQVFSGATLSPTPILSFNAFGANANGVRVAAGNIDGGSNDDIIATKGPGTVATVKAFHFDGVNANQILSFRPFGSNYKDGAFIATGDFDGDGLDDIIVGRQKGRPSIRVRSSLTSTLSPSLAAFSGTSGGVRVGATDIDRDGDLDIIAARGGNIDGEVRFFENSGGTLVDSFEPFGPAFAGPLFVAGGN